MATPAIMNPREDERGGAPSASPAAIAGNSADDAGRITYESSGIAPTVTSGREYREDALRTMGEEEFKDVRKQMNASDKEYWTKQMEEHPESSYAILQNMFASDETPQEKSKRERREQLGQVFANLGNVIGNAEVATMHTMATVILHHSKHGSAISGRRMYGSEVQTET